MNLLYRLMSIRERGNRSSQTAVSFRLARANSQAAEPGANLLPLRMAQIVENDQRLPVSVSGCIRLACGQISLAEVRERVGFHMAVTDLPGEVEGLPVVGDGLSVIAEVVVGVSEVVQGLGLAEAVPNFPVHRDGFQEAGEGLLVLTDLDLAASHQAAGIGFPRTNARSAVQVKTLTRVTECLIGVVLIAINAEGERYGPGPRGRQPRG